MRSERREYLQTRFSADVIKEAVKAFDQQVNPDGTLERFLSMSVEVEGAKRGHDDEDEFFSDYRRSSDEAFYGRHFSKGKKQRASLRIYALPKNQWRQARVNVDVEAERWPQILAVMDVFEANKTQSLLPPDVKAEAKKQPPVVFIGHGRSEAWKDLRDHLRDKHGLEIEAYEIGARAGHTIRDILQTMLNRASIAFLVMTGDDETAGGELHPRLNVVHEAGLFQGQLGFHRAVILLEKGVTEFSNIHGIEQIKFGNIKEVFGDVLATIRREFPND